MLCCLSYLRVVSQRPRDSQSQHIRFEFVSLLDAGISADRADVDHPIAEFNESAAFLGELHVRKVLENEVDQLLVLVLSDPLYEAVASKVLAQTNRGQPVLGEAKIEEGGNFRGGGAELFLLLRKIGAANLSSHQ